MLSLTKKTDYALIALGYLAERRDRTVSAREISEFYSMPSALVMNILKMLHHAGYLTSQRGTKGGYRLMTDLETMTLYDLVDILEGPIRLTDCAVPELDPYLKAMREGCKADGNGNGHGNGWRCKVRPNCPIIAPVQVLHCRLIEFLKQTRVKELLAMATPSVTPATRLAETL